MGVIGCDCSDLADFPRPPRADAFSRLAPVPTGAEAACIRRGGCFVLGCLGRVVLVLVVAGAGAAVALAGAGATVGSSVVGGWATVASGAEVPGVEAAASGVVVAVASRVAFCAAASGSEVTAADSCTCRSLISCPRKSRNG